jgi:hypothetical protein
VQLSIDILAPIVFGVGGMIFALFPKHLQGNLVAALTLHVGDRRDNNPILEFVSRPAFGMILRAAGIVFVILAILLLAGA